jgi:hypothetical protein
MANILLSQITLAGASPASNDTFLGVTAGNLDIRFTRAQLDASIAPVAINLTGKVGLAQGGTNADLSATGGSHQFLRQNSSGATVDVIQPAFTDLSGSLASSQLPAGVLLTYVATSDPGAANDNTQGYAAGSPGINTGTGRAFICRSASTGAAVWEPLGPSAHPGYIANNWYALYPSTGSEIASGGLVAGTTYLTPFFLPFRMTVHALGWRITTLGTSNTQVAIYRNNSGATPALNRPGTLVASTASVVNTSTGAFSQILSSDQQLEIGWYWSAMQNGDTTVRILTRGAADGQTPHFMGSATLGSTLATSANVQGVSFTGTFGTWPADISGSTFAEVTTNLVPFIVAQAASIP